jgi:protease-4
VWTGRQALERKLVDRLGGLDEAVRAVKEAAGIDAGDEVTLVHYPKPSGLLGSFLGSDIAEIGETAASRWIGERWSALRAWERADLEILEFPTP